MVRAAESLPPPPFDGFSSAAINFLRELAERQDRAWMAENKDIYEHTLREPLASLVAALSEGLADSGSPLRGDPKRSLFRINRDTRFSKEKRPYKTNVGATLTRDGAKLSPGLLYIHIDPDGSFTAAGFYHPEPPTLDRLRRRLADRQQEWRGVEERLTLAGLTISRGEALARPPRGYETISDPAILEILKLKSWIVSRPLRETDISSEQLVERVLTFASDAMPLLEFGWKAIDG